MNHPPRRFASPPSLSPSVGGGQHLRAGEAGRAVFFDSVPAKRGVS
ncbi:hypothetical protein J2W49_002298 [Hydrogenophaga palleronii]|uniref:Uncharacterized protein n=1 Tax=Hydrogenophaga palleronii TaxID=65655 RepID=A0ABU1WM25_9BURK|nr:hypothetical protein [Hydrogenophaga palleronii]